MPSAEPISRRCFVQALLATVPIVRGHGRIEPPVPVPDIKVLRDDGVATTLPQILAGHGTAIHLMFTSCTTTCPIQAAIFQHVQEELAGKTDRGIQLLSLSIDPEDDTPAALSAWRRRFHAGSNWVAAVPATADLPRLQEFFGNSADGSDHSTQVNIIDRRGRLVWRTTELPTPGEIMIVLQKV